MAKLLWGKIYFKDTFAGYLREDPGDHFTFTYDSSYIASGNHAIAHNLPVRKSPYISYNGLHPFFDNLVSEGWLENVQSRLLGKREVKRFELLLAFGFDCIGAVSIVDPEPAKLTDVMLDKDDPKEMAALTSRASPPGVQPKLAVIEENGLFRPTGINELSTHIAKFSSALHPDIIENEYLATCAFQALLPNDDVVTLKIGEIKGIEGPALLIRRFDRDVGKRIHFEEFNQLLNYRSTEKYEGAYKDISEFIRQSDNCLPIQNYVLYRRILAGLVLGNTDMHLKNFAMFHTSQGLRFTPSYDQVSASYYNYKSVALSIAGAPNMPIRSLKPRSIIRLGEEFGFSPAVIKMVHDDLAKNLGAAKQAIADAKFGTDKLKNNLIELMERRWNGTFALIGKKLSSKQKNDE